MALKARLVGVLLGVGLGSLAPIVRAEPPSSDSPVDSTPTSAPQQDEARDRFERGVALFDEQEYERALVEFERVYQLTRNYRVLYNIAQANAQMGRHAAAVSALERYIADGAAEIPPERFAEAQRQLREARARTAKLLVQINEPGAEVIIDDRPIAKSPLSASLLVDSGQRRITVRKPGFQETVRLVTLAGGDEETVDIRLEEIVRDRERTVIVESPSAVPLGLAWGITGALAAGTTVVGLLALDANSDLDELRRTPRSTLAERNDKANTTETLATVSTVLGGATVVSLGVALYLTLFRRPTTRSTLVGLGRF